MDFKSQSKLVHLYPDVEDRFYMVWQDYYKLHGKELKVSEAVRTFARQEELYNKGRSTPGPIVTYSKPGWSFHQYALAIDVFFEGKDPYLEKDEKFEFYWKEYGRIAESHGFVWGGHFSGLKDRPHIQLSYGLTITEIKKIYDKGGLMAVHEELDRMPDPVSGKKKCGIIHNIKSFFKGE